MITPVILSGGAGTRLWPLSRELYPKQLLPLTGERTMLQQTVLRLDGLATAAPVVVCNEAHRFLVAEQLRQLSIEPRATILEPFGRNTAPAIALAAHAALKGVAAQASAVDPVLLVLPADHVIRDIPAFHAAVRAALPAAQPGMLVTFGIVAHAPGDRLRLHSARGGRGRRCSASRASSRSPTRSARASSWLPASTTGTAACSCSVRAATWRSSSASRRRCRICEAAFARLQGGPGLHAPRSGAVRRLPGRLDRLRGDGEDRRCGGRAARTPAGAMWAPGAALHEASDADGHGNVTTAMSSARIPTAATCTPRAAWWRPSGSTTTWSWRPRMRCWWRRRTACRM